MDVCFSASGDEWIRSGFVDGKLRFMTIENGINDCVSYFYDYDKTVVPPFPNDKFVVGVYNGTISQ